MTYSESKESTALREANRKLVERYFTERPRDPNVFYNHTAVFKEPFFFPGRETLLNPELPAGERTQRQKNQRIFKDTTLYDVQIFGTDDPNFFWVMNKGTMEILREDGNYYPYDNVYVHYFRFQDGRIQEMAEFANPLKLLDGFGIPHPNLPTPEETNIRYAELGLICDTPSD